MLSIEKVANTRLNLKTLSVTFLVVVSFVLIDVVVSSLVDVYRDFITSPAGISLYLGVTGCFGCWNLCYSKNDWGTKSEDRAGREPMRTSLQ